MTRPPPAVGALVVVAATGLGLAGYTHLIPGPYLAAAATGAAATGYLPGSWPGDLGGYVSRLVGATVLLGLVPLTAALASGIRPSGIGLRRPTRGVPGWLVPTGFLLAVLVGLASSRSAEFAAFYPFSETLQERFQAGEALALPLHLAGYLLLYYLPWELCFRGALVFPLVHAVTGEPQAGRPGATQILVASLQALPSAVIHVGHPVSELLIAVPFGIALGWLALRTRSILPGLLIHAAVGLSLDTALLVAPPA